MDHINAVSPLGGKSRSELFLDISRYCAIFAATLGPFSAALMSVFCILMLIFWLASGQAIYLFTTVISKPVGLSLALFVLMLVIGTTYSIADWKTSVNTLWSWRKLIYIFILLGIFNSLYWKQRFVTFFLIGMSLALFLSYLAWFEFIPSKRGLGILATNYTVQSMTFVVATICCIIGLKDQLSMKYKCIYAILIVLFVINILYISESRTGYISLVAGSFVAALYVFGKNKALYIILAIIALIAVVAFSSQNLQDRVKKGIAEIQSYETSPELTSIGVRAFFAENTIEMIKKKPLLGYGTGAFETAYIKQISDKYTGWRAKPTTDPHNQYLYVWAENGILGLIAFLAFIIVVVRQGLRGDKYGAIGASVLCAWVISGLFNSTFKTFIEGHLLSLFLGVMLASVSTRISRAS